MKRLIRRHREWLWKHRLAWGLVLIVAFCLLRAIQAFAWRHWFNTIDFHGTLPFALFLLGWFVLLSVGLIGGGIVWLTKTSWRELGWQRGGLLRAISLGLLGLALIFVINWLWSFVPGMTDRLEFTAPNSVRLLLVAFFAFGMAAWIEENLFRGYFQPLLAKRVSLWMAIGIQALLFSAAHLGWFTNPLDFGAAFVIGLILGWLRGRERSLVAPFVAHGLWWMLAAFFPPTV